MASRIFSLGLVLYFGALSTALQVAPNSTCAALCLDSPRGTPMDPAASNTNYTDIACVDSDYSGTARGIKFKNCMECLQESKETSGRESDLNWYLYNARYAVDVCLYSYPGSTQNISSPCDINYACAPLKTALTSGIPDGDISNPYGYCSADGGKFTSRSLDSCVQCLKSSSSQAYISNFLIALNAGCQQKVSPGQLLGLSGSLFSGKPVTITDPPKDEDDKPDDANPTGMTTGAIVGIAVGAALLFLGGAALFIVYHQKQKKMYAAFDMQQHSDFDPRGGSASITPPMKGGFSAQDSRRPPMGTSDYEIRAQKAYGAHVGSNADYYDKLEEEMRMRRPNYTIDPHHPGSGFQGALPTHPAYVPRAMSRASVRSSSPQPPAPVKSNKPDSYALQAYLAAAEESSAIKIPPPPPMGPPQTSSRSQTPEPPAATRQQHQLSKPSLSLLQAMRTPPPPPSRKPPPKVPSLVLPSVPRIRMPKKYEPPQINVQEATPTDGPSESGADANISRPLARNDAAGRFADRTFGNRTPSPDTRSDAPLIPHHKGSDAVAHVVVDRRRHLQYEEIELHTGKSSMYG
ncbi:hypothetical protein PG997_014460 [Apiospora hydei]|uniref:LPXTG-domain-containing protein n=1 Tax=Apiospora hydei TaxID=1337664 RepID=A0ABR1UTV6_9PEZI